MDGAKTTREYYMFQGKEIKLTPNDRRIADETIRQESFKDAMVGVEAALFFELIENKHSNRRLDGIPINSSIRRFLREGSKNKLIVTKEDLIEP